MNESFPSPFQYMGLDHLSEVLRSMVFMELVLLVPTIIVAVVVYSVVRRLGLQRFNPFRKFRFRVISISLPLLALIVGLGSGYFAAWTDHQYYADGQTGHWYDNFAIFGLPGDGMADTYGGDWQEDEMWDYRSDIAIWNGLFWTTFAITATYGIRGVLKLIKIAMPEDGQRCQHVN